MRYDTPIARLFHWLMVLVLIGGMLLAAGSFTSRPVAAANPTHAARATDPLVGAAVNRTPTGGPPPTSRPAPTRTALPAKWTRTSRTYQLSNGLRETQVSPDSINYQDAKGAWQPIDDTLVPATATGYAYQNKANSYTLDLPKTLDAAPIRVAVGSSWITLQLVGAKGALSVDGTTATYTNAFPGVTVTEQANNDGVKETLTLANASAPSSFVYQVRTSTGVGAKTSSTGGIAFTDAKGQSLFSFVAPTMTDQQASTKPQAMPLELAHTANGFQVTVSADSSWLTNAARQWPVVIDPEISIAPDQQCYIGYPFPGGCGSAFLLVGFDQFGANRGLLHFDLQDAIPDPSATILDAALGLSASSGGPTKKFPTEIDLYQLHQSWTTGATWLTRDGSNSWSHPGGAIVAPPDATNDDVYGRASTWFYWGITNLVQGWVNGSIPNDGMLLKNAVESPGTNSLITFDASQSTLTIDYTPGTGAQAYNTFVSQTLTNSSQLGVNVANGNLMLQASDQRIAGTGLSLLLQRTYNSLDTGSASFGTGWRLGTASADIGLLPQTDGSQVFMGPSGYGVLFQHNPDGSFTSPTGIDATLVQNGDGTFGLIFHATGEQYAFNSAGYFTGHKDQNGNQIVAGYNSGGTLASLTDTQGRVETVTEDPTSHLITKLTDPAGRVWQYGYQGTQLTSATDPAGKVTQYAYTGQNLTSITDPDGNVTKVTYDSANRVASFTRVTNPGAGTGPTWTFTYNAGNTVVTDPNNHATTYTYDGLGRVTNRVDALGHSTSTTYTADSHPQTVTDALGNTTTYGYDSNNNLTSVSLPTGAMTSFGYTDSSHPYYPTSRIDAQSNVTTYTYDTHGNIATVTDGLASQNQFVYTYNGNGTLATITDARGNVTSYGYDSHGNLTSITPPSPQGETTITPDSLSRVASITDGKSQQTGYGYDDLDRVTAIDYSGGASIGYGYDAAGNRTSLTDSTGTTTEGYDALNRLDQEVLPSSQTLAYGYDPAGNLASYADAGGTVTYSYDAANRLTSLTAPGNQQTTFGYDNANRRTSTVYPNGVTLAQTYDASGRLTSIAGTKGSTTLSSFSYTYTKGSADTGVRQTMTNTSGTTTSYQYDALNRLLQATSTVASYAYTYDGNGNRLSQKVNGTPTSYRYNAANELTAAGSTTYSFDANGNETGNSLGLALSYNSQNQTTSVTPAGGSALNLAYTDTGQTQRITAGSTNFTNALPLGVMSAATTSGTTSYTRDNTGTLVSERQASGTYYPLFDGLGSVVALIDASGNVVDTYAYDPWGNVTAQTGSVSNPYQFGGAYGAYTDNTGLLKIGARYYDPVLGRWTQQDPVAGALANPATLNRYSYVTCNPINATDPSGMDAGCVIALAGYGFAVAALFVPGPTWLIGGSYVVAAAGAIYSCIGLPSNGTSIGGGGGGGPDE